MLDWAALDITLWMKLLLPGPHFRMRGENEHLMHSNTSCLVQFPISRQHYSDVDTNLNGPARHSSFKATRRDLRINLSHSQPVADIDLLQAVLISLRH